MDSKEAWLIFVDKLKNAVDELHKNLADAGSNPVAPKTLPLPMTEDKAKLFPEDLRQMLTFVEEGKFIVIKPRQFLGAENFSLIAKIVRDADGEYISMGKQSHFRIPKEQEQ